MSCKFPLCILIIIGIVTTGYAIDKQVVAVFEFVAENVSNQTALIVGRSLRSSLTEIRCFIIIERTQMDSVLKAQGQNLDECTKEGCGTKMGQLLDADLIILGEVSRIDRMFTLSARLIDLTTSEHIINKTLSFEAESEANVINYAPQLAYMLTGGITLKASIIEVGHEIFIDAGTGLVTKGQRFTVKRKGDEIRHPETGDVLGYNILDIGEIEVVKVLDDALASCKQVKETSLQKGDFVEIVWEYQPTSPQVDPITHKPTTIKTIGGLIVNSEPTGATVFLNGDEIGKTPLNKSDIEAGEHTMVIHREGYVDNVQLVTIPTGRTVQATARLVKMKGTLIIKTDPAGGWITINGKSEGEAKPTGLEFKDMPIGLYKIKAELDHYYTTEKNVKVRYGARDKVYLKLNPKPGSIFVTSTPSGADIILAGRQTRVKTPGKIENVQVGKYQLLLRLNGFEDKIERIVVKPDQTTTISSVLQCKKTEKDDVKPIKRKTHSSPTPSKPRMTAIGKSTNADDYACVTFAVGYSNIRAGYMTFTQLDSTRQNEDKKEYLYRRELTFDKNIRMKRYYLYFGDEVAGIRLSMGHSEGVSKIDAVIFSGGYFEYHNFLSAFSGAFGTWYLIMNIKDIGIKRLFGGLMQFQLDEKYALFESFTIGAFVSLNIHFDFQIFDPDIEEDGFTWSDKEDISQAKKFENWIGFGLSLGYRF